MVRSLATPTLIRACAPFERICAGCTGEMQRYQELYADGGEEGPHKDELETILEDVEELHAQVWTLSHLRCLY